MKKINNIYKLVLLIGIFIIFLFSSCIRNETHLLTRERVISFCDKEVIYDADVMKAFGKVDNAEDPIEGFFYKGEDDTIFIFELKEHPLKGYDPFKNKKINRKIKTVYHVNAEGKSEILWMLK